jgi:hypothetical protein
MGARSEHAVRAAVVLEEAMIEVELVVLHPFLDPAQAEGHPAVEGEGTPLQDRLPALPAVGQALLATAGGGQEGTKGALVKDWHSDNPHSALLYHLAARANGLAEAGCATTASTPAIASLTSHFQKL